MRILTISLILAGTAFFTAELSNAQTTGFAGVNDYTVNGSIPGSTSCNLVTIPPSTPIDLEVSAGPNLPVIILIVLCPCRVAAATFPPNSCVDTQTMDVPAFFPGCPTVILFGNTDAAGDLAISGPCVPGIRFSTQAIILGDPICGPDPIWSQAYDVECL